MQTEKLIAILEVFLIIVLIISFAASFYIINHLFKIIG